MPEIVGRDLIATAGGLFSTAGQVGSLIGSALAGVVIATVGAAWAVAGDAVSFVVAAFAIAAAVLPSRKGAIVNRPSLPRQIVDGWRAIADRPVVRTLVWLSILMNVPSFLGPLYPALVRLQLDGDASGYGSLEAVAVIGGMAGGAMAGELERRLGAGHLLVTGWILAGFCVVGMAASRSLPITATLMMVQTLGIVASGVASGALMQALTPEEYRGRVAGLSGALSVIAIPPSALLGGWLADLFGPTPLFAIGGVWILCTAILAWTIPHIRTARI